MPESSDHLGTGRTFRYEWETFMADVLDRLGAIEAGGTAGGSELSVTAQPAQTDPLLDLKFSDGSSGLNFTPNTGDSADGGDLYMLTTGASLDLYAYSDIAMVDASVSTGIQAALSATSQGGGGSALNLFQASNFAQARMSVGSEHAGISMNLPAGQSTGVLEVYDSGATLLFTLRPNGDVEIAQSGAGVILKAPDGGRHRIKVANDGTLSTDVVT